MEVEEGGRAGHGVREHAAGVGQQEAARVRHGAQHGAAGGRRRPRAALRSLRGSHPRASLGVCARPASRAPSRSPPLPPPASPPPRGAPSEGGAAGERRASARGPVSGRGCWGERARECGRRGCVRERTGPGGAGVRHFGATGALSAKSGACACVSVRGGARVCSGGRGSPWRTPTSNSPARREENPERRRGG